MKVNKRTGQKRDPKTGQFKRKPKPGRTNTPGLAANATFLEHLARLSDPEVVARKVARLARSGDWGALQLQIQALSYTTPAKRDSKANYDLLSDYEIALAMALDRKLRGELGVVLPPLPQSNGAPSVEGATLPIHTSSQ